MFLIVVSLWRPVFSFDITANGFMFLEPGISLWSPKVSVVDKLNGLISVPNDISKLKFKTLSADSKVNG